MYILIFLALLNVLLITPLLPIQFFKLKKIKSQVLNRFLSLFFSQRDVSCTLKSDISFSKDVFFFFGGPRRDLPARTAQAAGPESGGFSWTWVWIIFNSVLTQTVYHTKANGCWRSVIFIWSTAGPSEAALSMQMFAINLSYSHHFCLGFLSVHGLCQFQGFFFPLVFYSFFVHWPFPHPAVLLPSPDVSHFPHLPPPAPFSSCA